MDRLLAAVRQNEIALALQRARTLGGNVPCCGSKVESPLSQKTPLESVLLEKQLKCYTYMGTAVGLESMRLNAQNQCNIDASTDPVNPDARFSQYRGPYIPPVCPAIPQEILNGNLPKASTECPLPNKPFYRSRA